MTVSTLVVLVLASVFALVVVGLVIRWGVAAMGARLVPDDEARRRDLQTAARLGDRR